MPYRSALSLLAALLLLPAAASAQLRFQPPPPSSRLAAAQLPLSDKTFRVAIADSTRRETYWKEGFWAGVGIGAALGVLAIIEPPFGESAGGSGRRVYEGLLVAGIVGIPLGVIGGLIGSTSKKPVANAASAP